MRSTHLRKLLSVILAFMIAFSSVPFTKNNTHAESNNKTEKEVAEAFNNQIYKQNSKKVVVPPAKEEVKEGEVTSLLTENSTTIYNGDGEYEKQIFAEPIHRIKKDKKWENVSTRLVANKPEKTIKPANTNINVSFSEKVENGEYATYNLNGNSVQYSFLGADKDGQLISPENVITPTYEGNKITFPNIIENIDIRNITFDNSVKEDIILKKYNGMSTFTFLIKTSLKASLDKEKNIIFKDSKNNIVGKVPAPHMSDSNINNPEEEAAISYDVKYELKEINGGYELRIVADDEWLKSNERQYPVFIDPTTITVNEYSTEDTYVESGMPNNNYNAAWDSVAQVYWLRSGYYNSTVGTFYSFIKMPLDKLKGANLTDARLRLYAGYAYYPDSSTAVYVDKVNGSWTENALTWNNKPSSTNITSAAYKEGEWTNLNVTDTVKSYVANPSTNYGFKLHTNSSTVDRFKKFYASENATNKPYIYLTYNYPTPVNGPNVSAYSLDNGKNEGYLDFTWPTVPDATGYILSIYNGEGYEDIDVGNTTSWSTKGKGIWPTEQEIANGEYKLHLNGGGSELPTSPAKTYRAADNDRYGNTPNYFIRLKVKYSGGVSDISTNAATPILPMEQPKAVAKANPTDPNTGYVTLTWPENPGATGYMVKIFNGISYDDIDVGSDTSYTTLGEKIWPTDTEAGYHIHTDRKGAELAKDPSVVYRRAGTTVYQNNKNYWFRVVSYYGENKDIISPLSNPNMPTIPDQTTNSMLGSEDYWTMAPVLGGSINAINGNFVYSQTDFSLPSKIFGVHTGRTYNSQSTTDGIFGLGWTSPYEMNIKEDADGNILFTDEDGTVHTYDKVTLGTTSEYIAPVGQYRKIDKNSNGYVLTDSSDNTYTFDTDGKLTKIEAIQHLENGTNKVKEKLGFTYTNNKINAITVNDVNKVTYTYGSNGKVETVTYLTGEGNKTWTYSYTNNLLSSVTDSLNNTFTYEYTNDVLTAVREPNDTPSKPFVTTFVYAGDKLTSVTDAKDNTMNITYDSTNKKVSVTDFKGTLIDYYYDEYVNPAKVVVDPEGLNITTKTEYSQNSDVEITDPNGVAESSEPTSIEKYDDEGNLESSSEKINNGEFLTTCNQYDENNNLIKGTSEYQSSPSTACSNISTPTSSNGSQKVYINTYEDDNNVSSVDADSNSTVSVYDSNGDMTSSTKELAISNNMVANSGMEHTTLDNWSFVASSNGTGTYSLLSSTGSMNSGQNGVQIKPAASTNAAGYQLLKQVIPVKGDTTYTLSGYVKTNNLTNGKAYFNVLEKTNADGTGTNIKYTGHEYYPVKSTQDWTRRQITFTTDSTAKSILIYLEVTHDSNLVTGEAYFDDIQLEETETTSDYNPVENSSFEDDFTSWSGTEPTYATIDTNEFFEGEKSLKITKSYVTSPATLYTQTIPINQSEPGPITISGMNKAVYTKVGSGTTYNKIYVSVKYTDDSTDAIDLQFNKGTHDWQRNATTFNNQTKKIKEITLKVAFVGSVASVWFDNIKVQKGQVWSSYEYDSNGLLTKATNPLGTIVSSTYDSLGNQLTTTDGEGKTKTYTYDSTDQLKTASLPNGTKVVYNYDKNGNVIDKSITNASGSVVYNQTIYSYNELNQLFSVKDPLNKETTTTFDANGNVESIYTPNGKTITNIYDNADRLKDLKVGSSIWHTFEYDQNGNIKKTTDSHSGQTKTFTYDAANQVTSQTVDGQAANWTYDNGQLTNVKLPGEQNGTTYTYDNGDNNVQIKDNESKIYRFHYNDSGTVNTYISPDGTGTSSIYDTTDRITRLLISQNTGAPIVGYQYQYDKRDNITKITNDNGKVINYTYDDNNQLLSEDIPSTGTNVAYNYDEVGNRLEKKVTGSSNTTTSYQYNAANQLTKVDGQAYTYDNNGNLINDGQFNYEWDELNNLTKVIKVSDSSVVAEYKYDDQNRRIYKKVGSKITKFVYDGDSILPIYETDNDGALTYKYIYNANGTLVARYDVMNAKKYYYQQNPHGDVVAVTDDNGAIVASYEYDAWGECCSKIWLVCR